jgi:hypothetical protein
MQQLTPIQPVPPMVRDMDLVKNRLPSTRVLAGETIELEYDDGAAATLRLRADRVGWRVTSKGEVLDGEDVYDAVELRPGLFFLHFSSPATGLGLSHVIDRQQGRAITVWNAVLGSELQRFLRPARITGGEGAYQPIEESRELIGRRAYCQYSEEAALEHIYVNSQAVVWQWLLLPDDARFDPLRTEVGIEAVSMRKVRDEVFLLVLNDGGPVGLTLLMDFEQKRNVGCLFGKGPAGPVDRPCGAIITPLNKLSYPSGFNPG